MTRLGDDTPVHPGGRAAFDYMLGLVQELSDAPTEDAGIQALRAFITVRRTYQPRYTVAAGEIAVSPEQLAAAIVAFVRRTPKAATCTSHRCRSADVLPAWSRRQRSHQ